MSIESHRTKRITDLLGLEHHLLEALGKQRADEEVRLHTGVNELVIRMERLARDHYEALQRLAKTYGIEESAWKKTLGSVLGVAAGLVEGARDRKLSGLVRDDYLGLSLLAMQYTSVHAFATATRDEALATVTLDHLKDITPLLVALSRILPAVVVEETGRENLPGIDLAVGQMAVENTQRAWDRSITEAL